jgi:hypothetical protein
MSVSQENVPVMAIEAGGARVTYTLDEEERFLLL